MTVNWGDRRSCKHADDELLKENPTESQVKPQEENGDQNGKASKDEDKHNGQQKKPHDHGVQGDQATLFNISGPHHPHCPHCPGGQQGPQRPGCQGGPGGPQGPAVQQGPGGQQRPGVQGGPVGPQRPACQQGPVGLHHPGTQGHPDGPQSLAGQQSSGGQGGLVGQHGYRGVQ
ncbi:circumsporozoite protein-like [Canis lupus familiaris]|uniref:circumsporozoite protein-like n=1 Tax=Canis lupus familiaris TaxID=9615 RepID=UPI000DC6C317|nr:circumsporozoite protein-like [Canis lupus familiaris]XP_038432726.1 circumsporozoite protein-like [Canis lupus familiaris]XP_048958658.1 circumsporozoite protein-like [Canis lupus dingo]